MDSELERYILDHISPEDPVLAELDRQTHLRMIQPRMLSGHWQGRLLEMFVRMVDPMYILELGTFTGYSAIAMARGLSREGAELHTVEIDDELQDFAARYIERAGLRERIVQHIGPALEVVPTLGQVFDLVFIDADKREYPEYYRMLMDGGFVRSGSIILADNVLWYGKVAQAEPESGRNDRQTLGILTFNRMVRDDPRVEQVLVPMRDGLTIIRVR
ncbi:O-methyltransferase [uncultured Rikenella sp.]|uniref:O-methyltransferase n=1 Tax=uncultured Rikenella sp. TaxID=368003 RepID=UPI0025DAF916|nr:O-methyltransferase [uncultured Rikenella sp.]